MARRLGVDVNTLLRGKKLYGGLGVPEVRVRRRTPEGVIRSRTRANAGRVPI